jgi:hypothetical protein
MTFVPTRTDQTKYSAVDGKADAFATTVEAGAGGFGIQRTVKGVVTFEVLDAMPLNRQATQLAVETGSALTPGTTAAGFAAVDFATQDFLDAAEATAAAGIKDGEASLGDLT